MTNADEAPLLDNGTHWEPFDWDETKTYSKGDDCGYGTRGSFKSFKSLTDGNQGNPPLTGFYENLPYILGKYDSIYRVSNWIRKKLQLMDETIANL